MNKFIQILSSFFGLGYAPIAPGTFGSLGGVLLYFIMVGIGLSAFSYFFVCIILVFLSIFIANQAERIIMKKDPSQIVIDEVVGIPITMFLIPLSWTTLTIGFVLNRLLDIWKPFPAKQAQLLPGGWGIVLDDVISSIYANIILKSGLLLFSKYYA